MSDETDRRRRSLRMVDVDALEHVGRPASVTAGLGAVLASVALGGPTLLVATLVAPAVLALHVWGDLTRELVLGSDGFELAVAGIRRFAPWSRVSNVTWSSHLLTLALEDGSQLRLRSAAAGSGWLVVPGRPAELGRLGTDVAERVARHRLARDRPPMLENDLTAGDRDLEAWLARIDGVLAPDGYRSRMRRNEMREVVIASTEPTARAAAAIALARAAPNDDERAAVRSIVGTLADPDLRAVLSAATDVGVEQAVALARAVHAAHTRRRAEEARRLGPPRRG